jgi:hypothetical protein
MSKAKKPKMGRPPKGDDARSLLVLLRISKNEKDAWSKKAKAADKGLGPWIAQPRRDEDNTQGS